jgi:ligand-binding sensor domain-containing protein
LGWQCLLAQLSNAAFIHYTTNNGLSNDRINAIAKDRQGFLWVGTVNGLNRFDGRNFKVFKHNPKDGNSIPDNQVLGITLAPDGWLWVATNRGLCKLDPIWLDIERIPLPENADTLRSNDAVTPVAFDSKGNAWTTGHFGIYQLHPKTGKQLSFYKTEQAAPGWWGITIDKKDRLWMINMGLRRFDPATKTLKLFQGTNPREPFNDASTLSVKIDKDGGIWAGTWFKGIWRYEESLDEFVQMKNFLATLTPYLMADVDAKGEPFLWIGGGNHGLGYFYPNSGQYADFKPDLRDPFTHNNYIASTFFKDQSNGDVWIGTEMGLEHYAPTTIRFGRAMIPAETDMGQFSMVCGAVHDITDPTGKRYFIGVWGTGLYEWNKKTREIKRVKWERSNMPEKGIFDIFQDSKGYVWLSMNGGVRRFDPRTGKWRDYENFLLDNTKNQVTWCGKEDSKGQLWFGTFREGLYRYNPQADRIEQAFFNKAFVGKHKILDVKQISEDPQGRLWLASNDGNLLRYDPSTGEGKRFTYPQQPEGIGCGGVVAGKNGRVYALFHNVFAEFDREGKLLRLFNGENGIKSSRLYFLAEDQNGKIWFNSEYMLHCFDPVSGEFSYYGMEDGLFSNSMTDALCMTHDGEMFVGFQNAFCYFDPNALPQNQVPPPVAVTTIRVMNKERELRTQTSVALSTGLTDTRPESVRRDTFLTLYPGETFFEVEFAALNFNQAQRNRYAYKLDGFNDHWVYTDRPVATFTNLEGGKYLLRMKAANNDGIWNETGISMPIRVIPPLQKRWYFQWAIGLLVSGILGGAWWLKHQQRLRLQAYREGLDQLEREKLQEQLKSLKAQVNPHFLFNSLNTLSELVMENPQAEAFVDKLASVYRYLLQGSQEQLYPLEKEIRFIKAYFHLLETRHGGSIRLEISTAPELLQWQLPPLTLQLLVENAVKHNAISEESPLVIRLFTEGENLIVENNVQRRSILVPSNRVGLSNIAAKYRLLGGRQMEVVQEEGRFRVVLPLIST